jgi:CheY-like chemotaxis protein
MNHVSIVLIVDDEPTGRDILEGILTDRGYHLAFASNGSEALILAARLTPDLILLDVMMPGMDGFEVCQHLRADPLLNSIPVIMVTALDDQESRLRGIEAGADDFISKPLDRTELRARVHTITRLNRYRRLVTERTRFEWVVENTEAGYVIIHADDTISYANPLALQYLGITSDNGPPGPRTFLELAHKTYHCVPQDAWHTWPAPPDALLSRYLVIPETSTQPAFWLKVDLIDVPTTTEYLVRLRDVTSEVVHQQDIQGFHSIISHKLRTPMVGLLGGLNFLVDEIAQLGDETMIEFAEMAQHSAQRLFGDIEDITRYLNTASMAQSGDGFRLADLEPLVRTICTSLGIETFLVTLPEALHDAHIVLSPESTEVILWEILENSKKFHPEHTPRIEITIAQRDATHIQFQMSDDGQFLSPAQLSSAFEPYYQCEKVFTGEITGMGLGLSTVARLIWSTGGNCTMHNRDTGPGVVVIFTLPLKQ